MLSLRDLEKHLYKEVKSFLKPKGFKKKGDELIKDLGSHKNILEVVINYYATAGSSLNFAVVINFEEIDEIFRQFYQSTYGFAGDSYPLLSAALTGLKDIKGVYHKDVMTLDDADNALESFYKDFDEYIVPFFEQYSSLENIETYINRDYAVDGLFANFNAKSCSGLLLAHKVGRNDVNDVFQGYVNSWKTSIDDEEQKKEQIEELEKLMEFLGYA